MPSYAIKSSGIRQVAANSLIGNSTGSTGSAEELSATDAKTLLGLGTTDSPAFASAYLDNIYHSSGGGRLQLGSSGYTLYAELSCNRLIPRADATYDLGAETLAWNNIKNTGSILCYNGGASNSTNYERGAIEWDSNVFTIGTQAAGTGTDRGVLVAAASWLIEQSGTDRIQYNLNGGTHYATLRTTTFEPKQSGVRLGTTADRWTEIFAGGNTVTASTPMIDLAQTWNNAAVTFDAITADITDTASASDSNLINLKVGGTSKFSVNRLGNLVVTNNNKFGLTLNTTGNYYGGIRFTDIGVTRWDILAKGGTNSLQIKDESGNIRIEVKQKTEGPIQLIGDVDIIDGTTATSAYVYGSYSDASNYERGLIGWDSNVFTIGTQAAGTGTDRGINFVTGGTTRGGFNTSGKLQAGSKIYLHATATSNQPYITNSADSLAVSSHNGFIASHFSDRTSGDVHIFTQSSSLIEMTDTDGPQSFMSITPRVGQSGTAAYNGLKIDITESSLGDGSSGDGNNAILVTVGGTSKFKVDNAGNAVISGVVNQMTSSAAIPSTTEFPNDQDWGIHHDTANDHIYLAFNKSGSIKKTLIN